MNEAAVALKENKKLRMLLLFVVPALVVITAAVFWFTGGRYEATDNTYVMNDG